MIKLKDLLIESQKFDIEGKKVEIIRIIDGIQKGEMPNWMDQNLVYSILTNSPVGKKPIWVSTMGYKDDDIVRWKQYSTNPFWHSDGFWSQRTINSNKKVKVKGITYNYYITIDRNDKDNVIRFANNIFKLDKSLKEFADKKGVSVAFKTHTNLEYFLSHNDSLKVFYYNPSFKSDIESIVKKWVSDNNIKISDRSHTHGVDINGNSYGNIVAGHILEMLINTIKKHPKHSNEEYYQWLKKYFVDIIKNIKNIKFK